MTYPRALIPRIANRLSAKMLAMYKGWAADIPEWMRRRLYEAQQNGDRG